MVGKTRSVLAEHLEKIPYFIVIAQAGSIQAAARQLRLSQPSLSKSVQVLEEALGVALLNRGRRGVSLTEAGRELQAFAQPFLAQLAVLEQDLRSGDGRFSGEVRVGTHEIVVPEFWPSLVRSVAAQAPGLKLSLFTTPSVSELRRRLQSLDLDLIVAAEVPQANGLKRYEVRTDVYGFFAAPEFVREHQASSLDFAGLEALPHIFAADVIAGPGVTLAHALRASGLEQDSMYPVRSLESVQALAVAGLGVGILPTRMVKSEVADRRLRQVDVASKRLARLGEHTLYAAALTPRARDARIRLLRDEITKIMV